MLRHKRNCNIHQTFIYSIWLVYLKVILSSLAFNTQYGVMVFLLRCDLLQMSK